MVWLARGRYRAKGLDMISSSVVREDKYFKGIHDVMMVLGLRPEDGNVTHMGDF